MGKIKGISYKVHPNFFNNILEPTRKFYESKFNIQISQVKLTELLTKEMQFDPTKIRPIRKSRGRFVL